MSTPRTAYPEIWAVLSAPFADHEVKVLPKGGRQMKYITARTAMNRLDYAVGPENWWDKYIAHGDNSVVCELTIRLPDGRELTKADCGGNAGMSDEGDDDKSGFSDAFKRAAVKFGVGRYLYNDGVPSYAPEKPQPPPRPAPKPNGNGHAEPPRTAAKSGCREWFEKLIADTNHEWSAILSEENRSKEYKDIANVFECCNHIVKDWIAKGMLTKEAVLTDGKWDNAKVWRNIKAAWAGDIVSTQGEARDYAHGRLVAAALAAGINLDAEPEPAEATADG
jgi:hypothetical protein